MEMEKMVMAVGMAVAFLVMANVVKGGDPDIIQDFIVPEGVKTVDGTTFTFTGLRGGAIGGDKEHVGLKQVTVTEFPILKGTAVSLELLEFEPGTVNVPHTHPRGGELLFVMDGALTVGVVDSTGKLFKNELQKGDVFVFPKGLPHYQANFDKTNKAVALSSFGSINPGTVSIPKDLFASQIPEDVLTKSFKLSANSLQQIKSTTRG